MPKYLIHADHSPDICPSSNASVRARAMEMGSQLPKLAEDAGVRFDVEPQHVDPTHRTIAVVEAPSVEVVCRFVDDTGMSQWNTVEVAPLTPIAELMPRVNEFPILFH